MIHRLGININLDEARVLVASADRDASDDLAIDEFLDLIFNEKDALNVNLKQLPGIINFYFLSFLLVLSENE